VLGQSASNHEGKQLLVAPSIEDSRMFASPGDAFLLPPSATLIFSDSWFLRVPPVSTLVLVN